MHNTRTWRPLFFWLLDITLTNCFILCRLQVRRQASCSKLDWDPIEFNRALGSALLMHDLTNTDLPASGQVTTNTTSTAATKLKSIAPNRCRGVLLGIPKKVKAVTDLKSILLARGHTMCKEKDTRRECIGCKIDGKVSRGGHLADLTNVEYAKTVKTRCKQCNIYLCRKGKCWERYHNSRKY
jgi:hypothetical protein